MIQPAQTPSEEPRSNDQLLGRPQYPDLLDRLQVAEANWRRAEAESAMQVERANRLVAELIECSTRRSRDLSAARVEAKAAEVEHQRLAASLDGTETRLASVTAELQSVQRELADAVFELERTRATLSWRLTKPLRYVRSRRSKG